MTERSVLYLHPAIFVSPIDAHILKGDLSVAPWDRLPWQYLHGHVETEGIPYKLNDCSIYYTPPSLYACTFTCGGGSVLVSPHIRPRWVWLPLYTRKTLIWSLSLC